MLFCFDKCRAHLQQLQFHKLISRFEKPALTASTTLCWRGAAVEYEIQKSTYLSVCMSYLNKCHEINTDWYCHKQKIGSCRQSQLTVECIQAVVLEWHVRQT